MIDNGKALYEILNKILPTYYELALTSNASIPCISYQERNNYVTDRGTTIDYSRIIYTIKVWAANVEDIEKYSLLVDKALRKEGFRRTQTGELYDNESSMIQKIMTFEGRGIETIR